MALSNPLHGSRLPVRHFIIHVNLHVLQFTKTVTSSAYNTIHSSNPPYSTGSSTYSTYEDK